MGSIIYKPYSSKAGKDGAIFLVDESRNGGKQGAPTITGPDGKVYTGQFVNYEGSIAQYSFPSEVRNITGAKMTYGGKTTDFNGSQRYEGDSLDAMKASSGGAGTSAAGGKYPAGFAPGQIGAYGAYPGYLGDLFPKTETSAYDPITAAPYNSVDASQFAKDYGKGVSEQYASNYDQSKGYALDTLNTELQGLQSYVPAASALKANQTSIDNIFNQAQRTRALNQAAPGLINSLQSQQDNANTYSTGRLTNEVDNAAMNLNTRSQAADNASAGGFGAQSSVARKASDLMSAEQRFQIAQYGEGLRGSNAQLRNSIEVAPTEYTNAGSQIQVTPSLSASQLTQANQQALGQANILPVSTAYQNQIQQNQFATNLEQSTRTFNATNTLQNNQYNTTAMNYANQQLFQYQTGYAAALAGASQTNINAVTAAQQQADYKAQFDSALSQARQSGNWSSVTSMLTGLFGAAYGKEILNYLGGSDSGSSSSSTNTTTNNNTTVTTNSDGSTTEVNNDGSGGGGTGGSGSSGASSTADTTNASNTNSNGSTVPSNDQDNADTNATPKLAATTSTQSWTTAPALQNASVPPVIQAKTETLNRTLNIKANPTQVEAADNMVHTTLAQAGIYRVEAPGTVHTSTDEYGVKYYSNKQDLNNKDTSIGALHIQTLRNTIGAMGELSKTDYAKLNNMMTKVQDTSFHAKLDAAKLKGDKKAFMKILSQEFLNV